MSAFYPYSGDLEFLNSVIAQENKEIYIRLKVLDMSEKLVDTIEGKAIGGSLSKNGDSSIRVTGSVTMVVDDDNYRVNEVENIISINKKVEVEIGCSNHKLKYPEFSIIWFPQGQMCIAEPTITRNATSYTLSVNLKDKVALLNGDLGGTLSTAIDFSPYDEWDSTGLHCERKPAKVKDIIYTLVYELGGIPKEKIFIFDIEDRISNICSWSNTAENMYLINKANDPTTEQSFVLGQLSSSESAPSGSIPVSYGTILGYTPLEFVYPGTLSSNPGESIASVLDKIKKTFGNYEYFFDIHGNFIFQKIKDYVNSGNPITNIGQALDYFDINSSKAMINFNNSDLILSIQNSLQYSAIKNDYNVWGKQNNLALRYHLVLDTLPIIDESKKFYVKPVSTKDTEDICRYGDNYFLVSAPSGVSGTVTIAATGMDWRVYQYLDYVCYPSGAKTPYSEELYANLPKIVDFNLDHWETIENVKYWAPSGGPTGHWLDHPESYPYFLDMIETNNNKINQFNVSRIGRRTATIKEDSVNCMFSYNPPERWVFEAGQEDTAANRASAPSGYEILQVDPIIWKGVNRTVTNYSAFECIRSNLHTYLSYQDKINMTTLPIYYLDTNIRASIHDKKTCIDGDYIIKTISIPFTSNGTMSITAVKAVERV